MGNASAGDCYGSLVVDDVVVDGILTPPLLVAGQNPVGADSEADHLFGSQDPRADNAVRSPPGNGPGEHGAPLPRGSGGMFGDGDASQPVNGAEGEGTPPHGDYEGAQQAREILQARLSIPGAASSGSDFANMWDSARWAMPGIAFAPEPIPLGEAHSILGETQRLQEQVKALHASWSPAMVKLGAGALHCYKKRLTDMSERDQVHLLWVMCGGDLLRAHGGIMYVYDPVYGFWGMFEGIVPQHVLEHVRRTGLTLEGMFRSLKGRVQRDDASVLQAFGVLAAGQTFEDFGERCRMASVWNQGEKESAGGCQEANAAADNPPPMPVEQVQPAEQGGAQVTIGAPWQIWVARAVGRVTSQLVRSLEQGKLITKFAEWCGQPMARSRGAAYKDCVLVYDEGEATVSFKPQRAPHLNIYVRIPHNLLSAVDPALEAALERLQQAYQETFWANSNAFRFGQACLALATRGYNINQITVYWGPGGVGMSSYTSHLTALYGDQNHAMFDPNVFYDDSELRKTIEQLMGRFIYTGQERPVGNRHGVRQDLVKKFATGEGISGRMPYGVVTKLFKVIGWKRIELNTLINFDGVEEASFESVLRRFAITKMKVRLVEPGTLKDIPFDTHAAGVFERDPDLEAFYVSGPAVAAGLKLQHAFERTHNLDACRKEIIRYTRLGGDDGVGLAYMREACGLKPLEELKDAPSSALGPLGLLLEAPMQDKAQLERVREASLSISRVLLSKGWDFLTHGRFIPMIHVHAAAGMTREVLWRRLKATTYWHDAGKRRKSLENLLPRIHFDRPIGALYCRPEDFGKTPDDLARFVERDLTAPPLLLPEIYDLSRLQSYLDDNPARLANFEILIEALGGQLRSKTRTWGGRGAEPQQLVDLRKRMNSLQAMGRLALRLREMGEDLLHGVGNDTRDSRHKRARLELLQVSPSLIRQQVPYPLKGAFRSRRYVDASVAAQSMDQRMQHVLLDDTVDFDIVNCVFVLLAQVIERLQLADKETWQDEIELLQQVALDRKGFCEEKLKMSVAEGKEVLRSMLHGGSPPAALSTNSAATRLVALARFLRWLACSAVPDLYSNLRSEEEGEARRWPEASTLAFFWQGVEDFILEAMVQYARMHPAQHISLHFDGIRIDRARVRLESTDGGNGVVEMCARLQEHVKLRTGYVVDIVAKEHLTFSDSLEALQESVRLPHVPQHMLRPGNAIALGIGSLLEDHAVWARFEPATAEPGSQREQRARAYRDVAAETGVHLVPSLHHGDLRPGLWLLHAENGGNPTCFGVHVQNVNQCMLHWQGKRATLPLWRLRALLSSAIDKKTFVIFEVTRDGGTAVAPEAYLAPLLDLLA